jgi:hypothetical protein
LLGSGGGAGGNGPVVFGGPDGNTALSGVGLGYSGTDGFSARTE